MPLPLVIAEYESARKMVPDVPFTEIAKSYERHQRKIVAQKTIEEVKDELIESKRKDKLSDAFSAVVLCATARRQGIDLFLVSSVSEP